MRFHESFGDIDPLEKGRKTISIDVDMKRYCLNNFDTILVGNCRLSSYEKYKKNFFFLER